MQRSSAYASDLMVDWAIWIPAVVMAPRTYPEVWED